MKLAEALYSLSPANDDVIVYLPVLNDKLTDATPSLSVMLVKLYLLTVKLIVLLASPIPVFESFKVTE